jgi:phosphoribosylaminoimidazole-succinocarboxamide synthase
MGSSLAAERGLVLADTKFEFGLIDGELTLIDEVLTPDSSRYWDAKQWKPGTEPASFDKQFVRNWLDEQGWDHESPPPPLPADVVEGTRKRYVQAFRKITGSDPLL